MASAELIEMINPIATVKAPVIKEFVVRTQYALRVTVWMAASVVLMNMVSQYVIAWWRTMMVHTVPIQFVRNRTVGIVVYVWYVNVNQLVTAIKVIMVHVVKWKSVPPTTV